MDIKDGFIEGIYNYCDAWCERCALTSYCRLFADSAEIDASLDPGLRMVTDAPPLPKKMLPEEMPPPPPRWLQELLDECDQEAANVVAVTVPETAALVRRVRGEHAPIEARAREYLFSVHPWLGPHRPEIETDPLGPFAVISRFHMKIATKIYRALVGLASAERQEAGAERLEASAERQGASAERQGASAERLETGGLDHVGSAKVALLAIDESHAALLILVESGRAEYVEVERFIADLVWLGEAVEQVFPSARAFVRPGLDEPGAVARLRA